MNNRIKESFDKIYATEQLKDKTKAYLAHKTKGYWGSIRLQYGRVLTAAICCLLLLVGGGYRFYFTPISVISIDVNPSIELGINRFDKIISVTGYNSEGENLTKGLEIKYLDCTEALEKILNNESMKAYLSGNEIVSIVVVGSDEKQRGRMLSLVEACVAGRQHACCYSASYEEVAAAHEVGLSYGKYRVFLEIQALNPDITAEEVQGMTMREMRDLLEELSNEVLDKTYNNSHRGNGHGNSGNGHRNKQGQGD